MVMVGDIERPSDSLGRGHNREKHGTLESKFAKVLRLA